jgi:hypothetical protein
MIGIAARACLELGLHEYKPTVDKGTGFSRVLFACVYDLDKRCSFFADLPWTLQDMDIDVGILSPVRSSLTPRLAVFRGLANFFKDDRYPFLSAMIALDGIHTKISKGTSGAVPVGANRELDDQREIFDYRVQKLADNISAQGLFPLSSGSAPSSAVRHVMESFIQLRAYQIRMLAYMPYITTPDTSCHRHLLRQQVLSLIMSTVDQCLALSNQPGFERGSRLFRPVIDRLLLNAVSCMLLIVSQDSAKYGQICRPAFHSAIQYLAQSLHKNPHSDLWSVEELRMLGEKMQMPSPGDDMALIDPALPANNAVTSTGESLHVSALELARVCEATDHDALLNILGSTFAWESAFEGPHIV